MSYDDITAEKLLSSGIYVGSKNVRIHDGELQTYSDGFYESYFDHLAELGQSMSAPSWQDHHKD